jgi:hypothetical protein
VPVDASNGIPCVGTLPAHLPLGVLANLTTLGLVYFLMQGAFELPSVLLSHSILLRCLPI